MTSTPARVADVIAQHRLCKALALADALLAHRFNSEQVRALDDHGWHIVATSAGTTAPSTETRDIAIRIVEAHAIGRRTTTSKHPITKF